MKRTKNHAPKQIFTVEQKMVEFPMDGWDGWSVQFAFHASDDADAMNKATDWALYHSFSIRDVRVRLATAEETEYRLHNEYLR